MTVQVRVPDARAPHRTSQLNDGAGESSHPSSDLGGLPQRHSVDAITQAARGRAIRVDMAQVGVTGVANGFDALQVKAVSDDIFLDRLSERRPAGIRLEFLGRIEKHRVAAQAGIDSRLKETAHFRAKGTLRSGLPSDKIFLVTELFAPF